MTGIAGIVLPNSFVKSSFAKAGTDVTAATRAARARLSPESVRAALIELGLKEQEGPIDGYAFGIRKEPATAVQEWKDMNGGREPRRFYCYGHQFILSE